jgi:hypothetical protein
MRLTTPCSVPLTRSNFVLVYNADKYKDNPPTSWADFYDPVKIPGNRGIMNTAQDGGMETALLGAGITVVRQRWSVVLLAIVLVPFWTSLMARTFAWVILMQDNGVINKFLEWVGVGHVKLLGTTLGVRPFLEGLVRARVARIPNVTTLHEQAAG